MFEFKEGSCIRGDACPYAHGIFECWLHPTRYRTQLCTDGAGCRRRVCFFAHRKCEVRVPEEVAPLPQELRDGLAAEALALELSGKLGPLGNLPGSPAESAASPRIGVPDLGGEAGGAQGRPFTLEDAAALAGLNRPRFNAQLEHEEALQRHEYAGLQQHQQLLGALSLPCFPHGLEAQGPLTPVASQLFAHQTAEPALLLATLRSLTASAEQQGAAAGFGGLGGQQLGSEGADALARAISAPGSAFASSLGTYLGGGADAGHGSGRQGPLFDPAPPPSARPPVAPTPPEARRAGGPTLGRPASFDECVGN
ncbi:hypothetical protein QBZ16_003880 [Prototheca wickerhamii]|uniref:C3H1-type domain-containing protein n=1 Tax=Prototheca wickerhamii TaxID=3111 RepID=A0AAD9IL72_PROWI|nr:hypothetical protein QBZ16_003880 [Prototheca wickerhamii]